MDAKTQSENRRTASPGRTASANEHHDHQHPEPGIDLPFVGHVEYKSAGFLAGLGVAGAVGAIEWPIVAAVGIGYALARRG